MTQPSEKATPVTLSVPWQFDAELQAIAFVAAALDSDSLTDQERSRIAGWVFDRWGRAAGEGL